MDRCLEKIEGLELIVTMKFHSLIEIIKQALADLEGRLNQKLLKLEENLSEKQVSHDQKLSKIEERISSLERQQDQAVTIIKDVQGLMEQKFQTLTDKVDASNQNFLILSEKLDRIANIVGQGRNSSERQSTGK